MGSMALILTMTIAVGMGVLLFALCRALETPRQVEESLDRLDDLSIERYQPMMRLLDSKEIEFLRSQPGYTPQLGRRVRQERCAIFTGYLNCLRIDFHHASYAIKAILLQSEVDRPELSAFLLRSQFSFSWAMMMIRFHLALYRYGVGTVSVSSLLGQFDGMMIELRKLTPATSMSAA